MKRIVCLLLALICCLSLAPGVRAEEADQKILDKDRQRIRWAMAVTAYMAGNALDRLDETEETPVRNNLERISNIRYLDPDKAIVVQLDKDQANAAEKALNVTGGWANFGPALAEYINGKYENYARAVQAAGYESSSNSIEPSSSFSLIILPYGMDIALVPLTTYGSVASRGAFAISTRATSKMLSETDIDYFCQQFGVEGAAVRVYEKSDLEALLTEESWYYETASGLLINAVLHSEKRIGTMLPQLMQDESPLLSDAIKYKAVCLYLSRMEKADQTILRKAAEEWLPALAEGIEDPVQTFLKEENEASGKIVPPEIPYGHELHETELKPDGTYLIVCTKQIPDSELRTWYDVVLEAALPPQHIPETVESADYIILCDTTYEGGVSNNDSHLHYPQTVITVHDARTGEELKSLGAVKRTLSGVIMIGKGDTWWSPLRTMIWEKISPLFSD